MAQNITELTSANFEQEVLQASVPVLVDFWAPWCGPCISIAPILEQVADEVGASAKITKVNVDQNGPLAEKYEIRSIPNLVIFKNGSVADRIIGLSSKQDIKSKLV
ncbi:MAG: thioredoxin [Puniceicoccaceae bacterium]